MGKLLAISLILIAIPVRPDRSAPVAPPSSTNPLLGHWRLVALRFDGIGENEVQAENKALHITPTHMQTFENGIAMPSQDIAYTIDWTRRPATIDLMPKNGTPKRVEGILKIEGDRMFICFALEGQRPASFDVPAGQRLNALMQLQRVNK